MGSYTQRKRFESEHEAVEQSSAFHDPAFRISGITPTTHVYELEGAWWLDLTQEGALVTEASASQPGAILPGYEFVSYSD